jgi:predicted ArsR family transcriptional regulator
LPSQEELNRYLGLVQAQPSQPSEQEDFVLTKVNPASTLEQQLQVKTGRARYLLRQLTDNGYVQFIRNGGGKGHNGHPNHAWLVKAPDNAQTPSAPPKEPQLKLATEDASPDTDVLALIGQLQDHVRHLVEENEELREAANTAGLLRSDNERLEAEISDLREQHDHVIQTLGRLDEDVLRAIIRNAQKTQAD